MKNTNNTLAATQLSQVIEQLNKQTGTDELVNIYNDYAGDNGYERIYELDENTINELYSSPWQALYDSNHKYFNDRDYFFTYNGNGRMVSFNNEEDSNCPIDISELAEWLISEDKLSEYDIAVTTLDDMLASIEDNISDDSVMLNKLGNYLMVDLDNDSYEDNVYDVMTELNNYTYEQIQEIIIMLGINYQ